MTQVDQQQLKTEPLDRRQPRTAILVIHGMGEQNPYDTLDQFARGLANHFEDNRSDLLTLQPERINHGNWTEVAVHMDVKEPATNNVLKRLSVFEFYWAPYTEGKVTLKDVVLWLMRTASTPVLYLRDNLRGLLMLRAYRGTWTAAKLGARELWRATALYIPAFLAFAAVLVLSSVQVINWQKVLVPVRALGLGGDASLVAGVVCWALAAAYLLLTIRQLSLRRLVSGREPVIDRVADQVALMVEVAALVFWTVAGSALAYAERASIGAQLRVLLSLLPALAAASVAFLFHYVFVKYVGDVAVYVTADEKAPSYKARSDILDASCEAVARLLTAKEPEYERVIIAGHSLGSVIAYDTINELLSRAWAASGPPSQSDPAKAPSSGITPSAPDRNEASYPGTTPSPAVLKNKLKGLVTFGSPLDKIYYFFRVHTRPDQVVRAQILSFLHSFRLCDLGQDYGNLEFTYPDPRSPLTPETAPSLFPDLGTDFLWLNIWSPSDPVSGPLQFYRLDEGLELHYPWRAWGRAHIRYWQEDRFYAFVADGLL